MLKVKEGEAARSRYAEALPAPPLALPMPRFFNRFTGSASCSGSTCVYHGGGGVPGRRWVS